MPPPVATMRRAGAGDASIMRRVTNPVASNAARRIAARAVREIEVDELRRAASESWSGTRSPRGYGTHTGHAVPAIGAAPASRADACGRPS